MRPRPKRPTTARLISKGIRALPWKGPSRSLAWKEFRGPCPEKGPRGPWAWKEFRGPCPERALAEPGLERISRALPWKGPSRSLAWKEFRGPCPEKGPRGPWAWKEFRGPCPERALADPVPRVNCDSRYEDRNITKCQNVQQGKRRGSSCQKPFGRSKRTYYRNLRGKPYRKAAWQPAFAPAIGVSRPRLHCECPFVCNNPCPD